MAGLLKRITLDMKAEAAFRTLGQEHGLIALEQRTWKTFSFPIGNRIALLWDFFAPVELCSFLFLPMIPMHLSIL